MATCRRQPILVLAKPRIRAVARIYVQDGDA
jgi:hypothetical protein